MTARRVGVLGGLGPEATVEFMWRLLRATKAEDDQDHIPLVVESNCTIPSRITWLLEGKGEDPEPELVATAERLCAAGAEFLVMPCNTTHLFAPQITAAASVPFLNAIDAAAAAVTKAGARSVGIIGSPVLERTKLYEAPLAQFGAHALYPADQNRALAGIKEAKSKGPTAFSRAVVGDAAAELAAVARNASLWPVRNSR